jgi:hypothetical protein
MSATDVEEWRRNVRFQCDGLQLHYDGLGQHSKLHATIFRRPPKRWAVEILAEMDDGSRAEAYTFGDTLPLTKKMAREIAERFVTGKKIPKRLEWR